MKIALVHDYLKEYGGAESVLETFSDIFPDAPIYTSLYHPASFGPHRSRLEKKWSHRIHQSFLRFIPFASKLISPLRFLSPLAFKLFNFSSFDLIISSATGAYFPNSLNKRQAKLVCYCHTPPRYLYGLATARSTKNIPLIKVVFHLFRLLDFRYAQNVDQFVANSATTAARIRKFYRQESVIINPPVDIPRTAMTGVFGAQSSEGREHRKTTVKPYYLTGGRLARAKRYDIAIQACNELKLPLKIFGRDFAGFQKELKSIAGPTIEFLGEVSQEQKAQLFQNAQAFFMCSDNEDFGIVPVESMAYGTPVIGFRSGGVAETVLDGKTGILFDQLNPQSCITAICRFQKTKISPKDCIRHARQFDTSVFVSKISDLVSSL